MVEWWLTRLTARGFFFLLLGLLLSILFNVAKIAVVLCIVGVCTVRSVVRLWKKQVAGLGVAEKETRRY